MATTFYAVFTTARNGNPKRESVFSADKAATEARREAMASRDGIAYFVMSRDEAKRARKARLAIAARSLAGGAR